MLTIIVEILWQAICGLIGLICGGTAKKAGTYFLKKKKWNRYVVRVIVVGMIIAQLILIMFLFIYFYRDTG